MHGVHPDGDLENILSDGGIFGDEFELVGLYAVELLLTGVGDIPFLFELLPLAPKPRRR